MDMPVYLDYAATTPVDDRVRDAMLPYFTAEFGNPSSVHRWGQEAEAAVETARERVAAVLDCRPQEIVFTSCGSESDNLAIRGAALAARNARGASRIIGSRAEHHAVTKTLEQLEALFGFNVDWVATDRDGFVAPSAVESLIGEDTALVSVMYANNEIGTINQIGEIAAVCHNHGVIFHTDAVQAAAYLPIRVGELGVDLMSLGGHKFYGPKGVGALYIRAGSPIISIQTGGQQESGLRAGTQNVPYIVGFAEALCIVDQEREQRGLHAQALRDRVIGEILESVPDSQLTGSASHRLPNHASFAFKRADGNMLLTLLDAAGYACSSGSACKTGSPEPSEVMTAIGLSREWGLGSLRVTVGARTDAPQIEAFLGALPPLVAQARALAAN
jgi:cysteine desulfurase